MLPYNKRLKECSRELKKNMTNAESLLWSKVRRKQLKGYQFYRQKIIGNYIVDFYCPKVNLIIEVDGGQHYSDEGKQKDRLRDDYMASIGLKVLRFSDIEVSRSLDKVVEKILGHLQFLKSPFIPLFQRGSLSSFYQAGGRPDRCNGTCNTSWKRGKRSFA